MPGSRSPEPGVCHRVGWGTGRHVSAAWRLAELAGTPPVARPLCTAAKLELRPQQSPAPSSLLRNTLFQAPRGADRGGRLRGCEAGSPSVQRPRGWAPCPSVPGHWLPAMRGRATPCHAGAPGGCQGDLTRMPGQAWETATGRGRGGRERLWLFLMLTATSGKPVRQCWREIDWFWSKDQKPGSQRLWEKRAGPPYACPWALGERGQGRVQEAPSCR